MLGPSPTQSRRPLTPFHSFPERLICCLKQYKAGAVSSVLQTLAERGVAMPDGKPLSLLAPWSGINNNAQATPQPSPLTIVSKTGPLNGQGPLTTAFDPTADAEKDVNLVIYLLDPFTQVRSAASEP